VLSVVLFLWVWTPARLWADLARGHPGRRSSAPQMGALRSRARKSAENKIQTWKPGLHGQPRRAVDCAPYLNYACP